jgi:prepilin-type N-terminal cleavage/methylation domain-containing protein
LISEANVNVMAPLPAGADVETEVKSWNYGKLLRNMGWQGLPYTACSLSYFFLGVDFGLVLIVSTVVVLGRLWAFLTVINSPVFASLPIFLVVIMCMSDFDVVGKSVTTRKRSYPPIQAGEKVVVPWETEDYKMACCDCGLVHRLRFTVEGSNIIMQAWRDNRATAQLRRRQKHREKVHALNSSTNVSAQATQASALDADSQKWICPLAGVALARLVSGCPNHQKPPNMKNKKGFSLIEVIVLLVIVALMSLLAFAISADSQQRYSHEAYSSWCKLHQRTDFTYEEWKKARKDGLLDAPKDSTPVIMPMPIYSR